MDWTNFKNLIEINDIVVNLIIQLFVQHDYSKSYEESDL